MEVYLRFQKTDQVIKSYKDLRADIDSCVTRMYEKTLNLAALVSSNEQRPRIGSRQRDRENYPSDSVAVRARYELCSLIPAVIAKKSPDSVVALS